MRHVARILFVAVVVVVAAAFAIEHDDRGRPLNDRGDRDGSTTADDRSTSRSQWSRRVADLCTSVEATTDQGAFVRRLERIDRPPGDDRVDRWVELQRDGHALAQAYADARRSGDRHGTRVAALRLVEFGGRDREAARGLGLPDACVSAPAGATLGDG